VRSSSRAAWVFSVALACAAGCGAHRERAPAPREIPLAEVGRLEVGGVGRCTVTLFTQSHAITAAHCVSGDLAGVTPANAILVLGRGTAEERFPVDLAEPVGSTGAGSASGLNGDVAVLHLARPVPAEVARPRPLARTRVAPGDLVTFVGLGSMLPGHPPRLTTWRFDPTGQGRVMRPGDSGAPLLRGAPGTLGEIVAVASGYLTTSCAGSVPDRMTFGDVASAAPAIGRALAAAP
jgi:hypothetical protein